MPFSNILGNSTDKHSLVTYMDVYQMEPVEAFLFEMTVDKLQDDIQNMNGLIIQPTDKTGEFARVGRYGERFTCDSFCESCIHYNDTEEKVIDIII